MTHARFRDKYGPWALITGASDGIGKALADQVAMRGVNVVLCGRRRDELVRNASELAATHGVQTLIVVADLAQAEGVDKLEGETRHLEIGLVILSAGFATSGPFSDTPLRDELDMVFLNAVVPTRLAHLSARQMLNRGSGGIMLIGSILGRQGTPGLSCYAATKAYVNILAEGLHGELRPQGIDVLLVEPGPVHSGFEARAGLKYGSAATPELVAEVAVTALGKRAGVIPGAYARMLVASTMPLPRQARVRFLGYVMNRMRSAAIPAGEPR
jgi:uncharacterized protein